MLLFLAWPLYTPGRHVSAPGACQASHNCSLAACRQTSSALGWEPVFVLPCATQQYPFPSHPEVSAFSARVQSANFHVVMSDVTDARSLSQGWLPPAKDSIRSYRGREIFARAEFCGENFAVEKGGEDFPIEVWGVVSSRGTRA